MTVIADYWKRKVTAHDLKQPYMPILHGHIWLAMFIDDVKLIRVPGWILKCTGKDLAKCCKTYCMTVHSANGQSPKPPFKRNPSVSQDIGYYSMAKSIVRSQISRAWFFLVTKDKTECTKTYKQASNEAGFSKDLGEHLKERHKEGRKSRMCVLDFRQSLISNYSHWSIKNNLKDYSILSTHMWVSENEGPVKKI